jgi:hypothetical protein
VFPEAQSELRHPLSTDIALEAGSAKLDAVSSTPFGALIRSQVSQVVSR